MLPACLLLLSFFLHCSPATQHLVIIFLPLAPKEPHLCHFSPLPAAGLPNNIAAWHRWVLPASSTGELYTIKYPAGRNAKQEPLKTTALCFPISIYVSSPTAMPQPWTICQWLLLRLPELQVYLQCPITRDENQKHWKDNFCCFLTSWTRTGFQRTGMIIHCNQLRTNLHNQCVVCID